MDEGRLFLRRHRRDQGVMEASIRGRIRCGNVSHRPTRAAPASPQIPALTLPNLGETNALAAGWASSSVSRWAAQRITSIGDRIRQCPDVMRANGTRE